MAGPWGQLILSWIAPTTAEDGSLLNVLSGFEISYGTAPGTYTTTLNVGNVTQYTILGLQVNQRYWLVVRAFDIAGNRSAYTPEQAQFAHAPPVPSTEPLTFIY